MSVGPALGAELPGRLLLRLHVGWLPTAYANVINNVATGFGLYGEPIGVLVRRALGGSLVLRPSFGWRPGPDAGFELWLGYTHARVNGSASADELSEARVTDRLQRNQRATLRGLLHGLDVAVSWRFIPHEHVLIRLGLAYSKMLAARVHVDSPLESANRDVESNLERLLTKFVQTLELRLGAGYRF